MKIDTIFYKNSCIKKTNKYMWCGVVDRNGRMLKSHMLIETKEFLDHIYDIIQLNSTIAIDEAMYDFEINKTNNTQFYKTVSPTLFEKHIRNLKKDSGRLPLSNVYIFALWDYLFYSNEIFTRKSLCILSNLCTLQNIFPYIDSIRILRINHDFVELFGEENLEPYSLNEIYKNDFMFHDSLMVNSSVQKMNILKNQQPVVKKQQEKEICDNGMIMVKKQPKPEPRKVMNDKIYDYRIEIYNPIVVNSNINLLKQRASVNPENRNIRPNKIHTIMR